MDEITREIRLREWSTAIAECNNSGVSKREWCRQHGISEKTFYYRQRLVRFAAYGMMTEANQKPEEIRFAELTPPSGMPAEKSRQRFYTHAFFALSATLARRFSPPHADLSPSVTEFWPHRHGAEPRWKSTDRRGRFGGNVGDFSGCPVTLRVSFSDANLYAIMLR